MSEAKLRAALAVALVAVLLVPAGASAQEATTTLAPGIWEGSVLLSGSFESSGQRSDGTDHQSVRTVTASGTTFQAVVDDQGRITQGGMEVDLSWVDDGTGTTPVTLDRYHIVNEHHLTGILEMSGTATHIVANGILTWDTQTYATDGSLIEEVSGPEPEEVEWVFAATQADCTTISGGLIRTNGTTLMAAALLPDVTFDDDDEAFNNLTSTLWAWPQGADAEVIAAGVEEVKAAAEEILSGAPDVDLLLQLVLTVEGLKAELARLETCLQASADSGLPSNDSWLAEIVRQALNKALDLSEFTPQELIAFLNIGARAEAIDADLRGRFGVGLDQALVNSITAEDIDSIWDIAIAAAQYGYPEIYLDAVFAAEQLEADPP